MRGVLLKELRLLRASGLLFVVPVLVVAAVGFSLRDGRAWSEVRARTAAGFGRRDAELRAKGGADARKEFESMANPYVATYYGEVHAALPPGPLAAIARGTSDVLPNVETVGAKPDEAGAGAAESRNPEPVPRLPETYRGRSADRRPERRRPPAGDEAAARLHPRDGEPLPQPHRPGEPGVLRLPRRQGTPEEGAARGAGPHRSRPRRGGPQGRGLQQGMPQRVGIALAVAKDARALLLDEPTSGLDPRACHEFAALMATHDLFNAKECGTRVGILHRGRLVDAVDAAAVTASELEARFLQSTLEVQRA